MSISMSIFAPTRNWSSAENIDFNLLVLVRLIVTYAVLRNRLQGGRKRQTQRDQNKAPLHESRKGLP